MNWYCCWLAGYGHKCGGGFHRHHMINKSKVPKKLRNKAMRDNLNKLLVPVCANANVSKLADTPWARKILLERLSVELGEDLVKDVLEKILGKFKRYPYELSYDSIISGPEPPDVA